MKAVKTLILAAAVAAAGAAMAGDRLDAIQKSGVIRVGTPPTIVPSRWTKRASSRATTST